MQLADRIRQTLLQLSATMLSPLMSVLARTGLDAVVPTFASLNARLEHEEHFRPGKPVPTHRDA